MDDLAQWVHEAWHPWSIEHVVERLRALSVRWWFAGGTALELHAGASWREHADLDIGLVRGDLPALAQSLADCELWVAAAGALSKYEGQPLRADAHQNNVWVRAQGRWRLDILLGDGDEQAWRYRRDPSISRAWNEAVRHTDAGVPYLAPDLQLLFKSAPPRDKDTVDAQQMAPRLRAEERTFLLRALPREHAWREFLSANLP